MARRMRPSRRCGSHSCEVSGEARLRAMAASTSAQLPCLPAAASSSSLCHGAHEGNVISLKQGSAVLKSLRASLRPLRPEGRSTSEPDRMHSNAATEAPCTDYSVGLPPFCKCATSRRATWRAESAVQRPCRSSQNSTPHKDTCGSLMYQGKGHIKVRSGRERGQHLASSFERMSVSAIQARASGCAFRTTCSSAPTRRTKLSAMPAVSRWGRKALRMP